MSTYPAWQYDEFQQIGKDYANIEEVQAYDTRHAKIRDIKTEIRIVIDIIGLNKNDLVLEFGSGTGEFAIEASRLCEKVYAVDISPVMLEFARQKAENRGISNIKFCHAGFLTYEHKGMPLNAVVSQLALHHLPDFWKLVALRRIYKMLSAGGKFYLRDIVYTSKVNDYDDFFSNWISNISLAADDKIARDIEAHIKNEYSTLDWVMEGLIQRAGFSIDKLDYHEGFMGVYVCTKK